MPTQLPIVSIVFSFRNEASGLRVLVDRIGSALANTPVGYELVFVDDASNDGSRELLLSMAAADARIKLITMSRRFGQAECLAAGLAAATGDAVIVMDADLQDPPELLPELIRQWQAGADVVHTVRRRRLGESRAKMGATALAYRLVRALSSIDVPVDAGDFKLLSRRALNQVVQLREQDPYLRGLAAWVGFTQVVVPYDRQPRASGTTHFPFFSRGPWWTIVSAITSLSVTPLVVVLPAGLALFALGLALTVYALLAHWSLGWTLLAAGAAMAGLQLIAVGIVALYLAKLYGEVRRRPRYIVAESHGIATPVDDPHR